MLDSGATGKLDWAGTGKESPMSTTEFIRNSLKQMHNMYNDAIADLTSDIIWRARQEVSGCVILVYY